MPNHPTRHCDSDDIDNQNSGSSPEADLRTTRVATSDIVVGTNVPTLATHSPATNEPICTLCGSPVVFSNASANADSNAATDTAASDDSIPMSYDSFNNMIYFLACIFNHAVSDVLINNYWVLLRHHSALHLRTKAYQIARTSRCFPLPCDFIDNAEVKS